MAINDNNKSYKNDRGCMLPNFWISNKISHISCGLNE